MNKRSRGMLPGEYMKISTVKVFDENALQGEVTMKGIERRPDIYVVVVRRFELEWTVEILKTMPLSDGVIPDAVVKQMDRMKDRIMAEERRDRGKAQALARKAEDFDDDFQPEVLRTG